MTTLREVLKRRFWQIHLSTAIVMMFATSGYMAWLFSELSAPLEQLANPAAHPNPTLSGPFQQWLMKLWTTPFLVCSLGDFVTGLFLIAVTGAGFEFFLRCREARTP
jgi:hypothetical protein